MGLGEAADSETSRKRAGMRLLLRSAALQRVKTIAQEPFHLQQEVKACDYTQSDHRAPCREFASISKGEIKTHKEKVGGGEGNKERCSQLVHEINVGPNLRSFFERKGEIGTEESQSPFSA